VAAHFAPAGQFLTWASHPMILAQIGFMLVVAATAKMAWLGTAGGPGGIRGARQKTGRPRVEPG
jgi:hypothetical protein